nr:CDGSH iron-sulfur domain-containing protein [Streptomyces avicenniae]
MSIEPGGPVLVEGPVEYVAEDGSVTRSDRPVVALCTCRRSKTFPFCDTSHRRRSRNGTSRAPGRPGRPGRPGGEASRDG